MVRIAGQAPRRGSGGIAPVVIAYERPSRTSRTLVVASAVVVLVLSGWVLTPIVLAKYSSAPAPSQLLREAHSNGGDLQAQPAVTPPTERAARETHDLVIAPPAAAAPIADKADPPDAVTATIGETVTATVEPAPAATTPSLDRPALAAASAVAPSLGTGEPVAAFASGTPMPWPSAGPATVTGDVEPAVDVETSEDLSATPPDFGPVPLPRRRPNAAALAGLEVPLPRPRPLETSAPGDTIPPAEQMMFDRHSTPN